MSIFGGSGSLRSMSLAPGMWTSGPSLARFAAAAFFSSALAALRFVPEAGAPSDAARFGLTQVFFEVLLFLALVLARAAEAAGVAGAADPSASAASSPSAASAAPGGAASCAPSSAASAAASSSSHSSSPWSSTSLTSSSSLSLSEKSTSSTSAAPESVVAIGDPSQLPLAWGLLRLSGKK